MLIGARRRYTGCNLFLVSYSEIRDEPYIETMLFQEYLEIAMTTQTSSTRRHIKDRIAHQSARLEELEDAGHKALAHVARDMLTALQKSEELLEPQSYRRTKKKRAPRRAH